MDLLQMSRLCARTRLTDPISQKPFAFIDYFRVCWSSPSLCTLTHRLAGFLPVYSSMSEHVGERGGEMGL